MDDCKHCGYELGYWRLWRAYWSFGPLSNYAPKTLTCLSCGNQNSIGMGTGIAGVLLVIVVGTVLAVVQMQIDLPLNAEVEEFIDIFLLSYFPAVIIVSFAYPLFARLGKESPPMLYRWHY